MKAKNISSTITFILALIIVFTLSFLVACKDKNDTSNNDSNDNNGNNQINSPVSQDGDDPASQTVAAGASGWPAELPDYYPKYPDGTVDSSDWGDNGGMYKYVRIIINDSSRVSFDQYVGTLTETGWRIDSQKSDTNIEFMKSGDSLSLMLYDDETTVYLFPYFRED